MDDSKGTVKPPYKKDGHAKVERELDFYKENLWQVRPCIIYNEEYKFCQKKSCKLYNEWRTGKQEECSIWKTFFDSCVSYDKTRDIEHVKGIIDHENRRREERLQAAKNNDVWEYRKPFWDDKKIKDFVHYGTNDERLKDAIDKLRNNK